MWDAATILRWLYFCGVHWVCLNWLWGLKRATLLSSNPLCWWVWAHTWHLATHGHVPKLRRRELCLSTLLSRNPWCTYTQCIATHNRDERQKLPSSRKWAFHWQISSERSKLLQSSLKYSLTATCRTPKWSQFIDVNWLVNRRCVLNGHIANHWGMAATSGGTGFAESLQHCIGHQSSAPYVYGRLTAQNLPYEEDIELWVLKLCCRGTIPLPYNSIQLHPLSC